MTIDTRHRDKNGEISREHSPIVVFARPFAGTKHEPFLTVYFCEYFCFCYRIADDRYKQFAPSSSHNE